MGVKASAEVLTSSGKMERYTFIYDSQELPWKYGDDNDVAGKEKEPQPLPNTGMGFWSTFFTLVLVVLAVVIVLFLVRCVKVQILKRKRERLLKSGNQSSVVSAANDV